MTEEKKIPEEHEVTDEKLEDVAGGVLSDINVRMGIAGEATDDDHKKWIEILEDDPPPKEG